MKHYVSNLRPIPSSIVLRCYLHKGPVSGEHLYLFMYASLRLVVGNSRIFRNFTGSSVSGFLIVTVEKPVLHILCF